MIAFSYIRDAILIDGNFVSELQAQLAARKVAAGATILIAARTIRHAPAFALRLDSYSLVVAADEYDPAGGTIDVSGRAGSAGAPGSQGAAGSVSATGTNDKPGGNGGNGAIGGAGAKGNSLKVFAKSLVGGAFFARGGDGGAGGKGGNGGVGKTGGSGAAGKNNGDPGDGGGNGSNGNKGGDGGGGGGAAGGCGGVSVAVALVGGSFVGKANTQLQAGTPGTGGAGGTGGFEGNANGKPQAAGGALGCKGVAGEELTF